MQNRATFLQGMSTVCWKSGRLSGNNLSFWSVKCINWKYSGRDRERGDNCLQVASANASVCFRSKSLCGDVNKWRLYNRKKPRPICEQRPPICSTFFHFCSSRSTFIYELGALIPQRVSISSTVLNPMLLRQRMQINIFPK